MLEISNLHVEIDGYGMLHDVNLKIDDGEITHDEFESLMKNAIFFENFEK
jgi:hypothetical protein